jgi:hypothetical protein
MANTYTPFNICEGPADVYWAGFGTTEPADSAVTSSPSGSWTGFGGTTDGTAVLFEVDLTYGDLTIDQLVDPVGARLTKREIMVTFAMEETTLNNMLVATNQLGTLSTQSNYTTLDPLTTGSATQPSYTALIIDGWAPTLPSGAAARRRIIARKAVATSKIQLEYQKTKPAQYAVSWKLYFVSNSIPLYHLVDQTA